jgi:hypothetical protein
METFAGARGNAESRYTLRETISLSRLIPPLACVRVATITIRSESVVANDLQHLLRAQLVGYLVDKIDNVFLDHSSRSQSTLIHLALQNRSCVQNFQ